MPATQFSGHETFPLRFLWLPKAVRAAAEDPGAFRSADAIARFGVGKNMVRAMRHWGLATGALRPVEGARGDVEPTAWGAATFGASGSDPYCEAPATAWRLHWRLCREPDRATLWHYLFGHWRGGGVDLAALAHALGPWLGDRDAEPPSAATLRRDLLCLGACYAPVRAGDPEDAGLCPLAGLGLVQRSAGTLFLRAGRRAGLSADVFADAVLDYWDATAPGRRTLAVDEVMTHAGSPGRVFLLSQDQAFDLLDAAAARPDVPFAFDDTAGLQQLYRADAPALAA